MCDIRKMQPNINLSEHYTHLQALYWQEEENFIPFYMYSIPEVWKTSYRSHRWVLSTHKDRHTCCFQCIDLHFYIVDYKQLYKYTRFII